MAGFVKKCPCLRPKMEEEVRVLDYRHSSLADVPSEVFNVERTLEELYADSNQIRDLPRELFYCHGLRKLSISDNEVTSIPPAISSLANLEELDISKNGIIDVPDNIKNCKYLRSIDASVNPLGKLPEGFTQLANLTHLFLNDTFLDYLPGSFGRMVKLKILELRENHLKTLPRTFSRLVELERLDIGNNEFTELSDVVGSLRSLLELWCDTNQITTLTHTVGNLKQLVFLDASNNQLQELPTELEGCVSLADLHLTSNNLLSLPDSIGNLTNLTTLKADDNQLTSLPKTLGGLSSLSELNVSTNELEDLPASIGLLRNLRTFYADENFLQFIPAELGSCSGITVLSLRSNKMTYIPDEIGRIPRLRVLNLSDNCLRYLPFSIIKLKELQALWLTENQTRPLIPLQSEYEPGTGRKILTCYLLPQGDLQANDERDPGGDNESFHASMWDEERLRRQQIHFDFADQSDEEGTLVRCPTPYPKEMREKVRHARNLAMRQMINTDGTSDGASADKGRNVRVSGNGDQEGQTGFSYSRMPDQSEVRVREARITTPTSPTLQESHRLYRFDKEKQQRDKARMQHRLSVPDLGNPDLGPLLGSQERGRDKKGKSKDGSFSRHSGSVPDLSVAGADGNDAAATPTTPTSSTYEDLYYRQFHRHRGRRSRRTREYDSDTGYRSDREVIHFKDENRGGNSETLSIRSQPLPYNHHHRRRHGGAGYASDLESYAMFTTANAAVAAFQQKQLQQQQQTHHHHHHHQHHLQQQQQQHRPAGVQPPNNISIAGPSPHGTPTPAHSLRPHSPSKSEPRHFGTRRGSDTYPSHSINNTSHPSNNSYIYQSVTSQRAVPLSTSNEHLPRGSRDESYQSTDLRLTSKPYGMGQSSQRPTKSTPPPIAPKPNIQHLGGSNGSLTRIDSAPSPPVFHNESFVDQSTPILTQAPTSLSDVATNQSTPSGVTANQNNGFDRDMKGGNLYTLMEERSNLHGHPTSQAQHLPSSTPPPYPAAPPYRRVSIGAPRQERERLSSDSSSSRVDSPAISTFTSPLNPALSSPCGFHGSNPYSDLPTNPRDKFSYGDYAELDRRRHLGSRDNHTSRSGSSSSQIGSASQLGSAYPSQMGGAMGGGVGPARDRSSSFDSNNRESPRPASAMFGSGRPGSRQEKNYPGTYDDLATLPNQEQSSQVSQVSSSTDSGYGHGHHVYERIGDFAHNKSDSHFSSRGPGSHSSDATSTPPSQRSAMNSTPPGYRPSPMRRSSGNPPSREMTPIKDHLSPDSTSQEHKDEFRISIQKNPGLGFSIAGGLGSHGNPYRPHDKGIFVTKVIPEGPASKVLCPGDKLLEVNQTNFRHIEHGQAVAVLKNSNVVNMLVERVQKVNMV